MRPELVIAFAVHSVVELYTQRFGFHSVGPFVPHPLAPSVEVMPLVVTYEEIRRRTLRESWFVVRDS